MSNILWFRSQLAKSKTWSGIMYANTVVSVKRLARDAFNAIKRTLPSVAAVGGKVVTQASFVNDFAVRVVYAITRVLGMIKRIRSDETFFRTHSADELEDLMSFAVTGIREGNPFQLTVHEQIERLRVQNTAGGWGISEEVFEQLAENAPEWPFGRDTFRSFRIRFGKGTEGVQMTLEAHAKAIRRLGYWNMDTDRVQLNECGNDPHSYQSCVEWCIIRLLKNRQHTNIKLLCNGQSSADEGLVLAWLFPERLWAIDHKEGGWHCLGYEIPGRIKKTLSVTKVGIRNLLFRYVYPRTTVSPRENEYILRRQSFLTAENVELDSITEI